MKEDPKNSKLSKFEKTKFQSRLLRIRYKIKLTQLDNFLLDQVVTLIDFVLVVYQQLMYCRLKRNLKENQKAKSKPEHDYLIFHNSSLKLTLKQTPYKKNKNVYNFIGMGISKKINKKIPISAFHFSSRSKRMHLKKTIIFKLQNKKKHRI